MCVLIWSHFNGKRKSQVRTCVCSVCASLHVKHLHFSSFSLLVNILLRVWFFIIYTERTTCAWIVCKLSMYIHISLNMYLYVFKNRMHVSFWPPQCPLPSTFTFALISQYPYFFWQKDILHQNHLKLSLKCNEVMQQNH